MDELLLVQEKTGSTELLQALFNLAVKPSDDLDSMVFNCINPALKILPFLPEDCLNVWDGPLCDSLAA